MHGDGLVNNSTNSLRRPFSGRFSEILLRKLKALGDSGPIPASNTPDLAVANSLRAMPVDPIDILAIGASTGRITRQWLAKQRRYAVLVAFLIAAVITPTPDPFNQTLVAIPMYLLFELGLFVARFA